MATSSRGQSGIHSELKASLEYLVRPCLKKTNKHKPKNAIMLYLLLTSFLHELFNSINIDKQEFGVFLFTASHINMLLFS